MALAEDLDEPLWAKCLLRSLVSRLDYQVGLSLRPFWRRDGGEVLALRGERYRLSNVARTCEERSERSSEHLLSLSGESLAPRQVLLSARWVSDRVGGEEAAIVGGTRCV